MEKIDISKIVHCTDIEKVRPTGQPKLKYTSKVNAEATKHDGCWGIQQLMDKFRKIYGWRVYSNKWNEADNSCDIAIMNNTSIVGIKHYSYDDICREMQWHSFEVIDQDTVRPVPFSQEEKEALVRPKIKATSKKDAAAAKLAEKAEAEEKVA